jgi:hypothetical protein
MDEETLEQRKLRILGINGVTRRRVGRVDHRGVLHSNLQASVHSSGAWESRAGREPQPGDLEKHEISAALDACLAKDWVMLTRQGHVERDRGVLGEYTGNKFVYPDQGVVLTDSGHELHSRVLIEIFAATISRANRKSIRRSRGGSIQTTHDRSTQTPLIQFQFCGRASFCTR